jgi:hypothetical protein
MQADWYAGVVDRLPEQIVARFAGDCTPTRPRVDNRAAQVELFDAAQQLRAGILNRGRRDLRQPDQPFRIVGAELGHPVVVRPDTGDLQLTIVELFDRVPKPG